MKNADQSAYPFIAGDQSNPDDRALCEGLSKKEKLAMEIYAVVISTGGNEDHLGRTAKEKLAELARRSIVAADIFFEQLK